MSLLLPEGALVLRPALTSVHQTHVRVCEPAAARDHRAAVDCAITQGCVRPDCLY